MDNEENVNLDTEMEELEELEEIDTSEEEVEEEDDEKPQYTDREKQLYARLKKEQAERTKLEGKLADMPTVESQLKAENPELSQKDLFALVKADVNEEDVDDIIKTAKVLGVSVSEALKDNVVKAILADKQEKRNTARATSTKTSRGGQKKVSDAELLSRASKGDIPEPGTPEAEQLFHARHGREKRGA